MKRHDAAAAAIVAAAWIAEREVRRHGVPDHAVQDIALDCVAGTWRASLRDGVDASDPAKLRRFMLVIARRMAWDWRHHNRHVVLDIDALDVHGADPMHAIEARAELRRVAKLVTPGDRRLLVALADGATFAEMARSLRLPLGTLASRVRLARRRLRAALLRSK